MPGNLTPPRNAFQSVRPRAKDTLPPAEQARPHPRKRGRDPVLPHSSRTAANNPLAEFHTQVHPRMEPGRRYSAGEIAALTALDAPRVGAVMREAVRAQLCTRERSPGGLVFFLPESA